MLHWINFSAYIEINTFSYEKTLLENEAQMASFSIVFPKLSVFIGRNRYYVIIAFKMLKAELAFEYARLLTEV